jgi:hypothetical protein
MKHLYTKPLLNKVELVADQAVMGPCKTSFFAATAPDGGTVDCEPGGVLQCRDAGS